MSVYVDAAIHPYGRMIMCHMIADTPAELAAMADLIGVQRKWFQRVSSAPHFDISKSKRALAVAAGAVETLDRRTYVALFVAIRRTWPKNQHGEWVL